MPVRILQKPGADSPLLIHLAIRYIKTTRVGQYPNMSQWNEQSLHVAQDSFCHRQTRSQSFLHSNPSSYLSHPTLLFQYYKQNDDIKRWADRISSDDSSNG